MIMVLSPPHKPAGSLSDASGSRLRHPYNSRRNAAAEDAEGPAMLRFEGDKDFSRPPPEVSARLTDPSFLVRCIPDVDPVKALSADRAVLVLRPAVAFERGTLYVTFE